MVKAHEQAEQIQSLRAAARKQGYAKAVRRWAARVSVSKGDYLETLSGLPVYWA